MRATTLSREATRWRTAQLSALHYLLRGETTRARDLHTTKDRRVEDSDNGDKSMEDGKDVVDKIGRDHTNKADGLVHLESFDVGVQEVGQVGGHLGGNSGSVFSLQIQGLC